MHYAVVRRRVKLTAQHRVIYAIPCKTIKYHAIPKGSFGAETSPFGGPRSAVEIIYLMFISDLENLLSDWENVLSVAIMH